jgi:hypothetical protein
MNNIRSPIHLGRALAGCLLAILAAGSATAEQPRITLESAIRYLQQDIFISPGVGFQKVQVGHSFQHVALTWGNPNQAYDSDVGSRIAWVYRVDNDSEIALIGSTRVESIEITGSFNSSFTSSEGANFGMTPHQVISIYGRPAEDGNLVKLRYPDKGIAFGFKNGALRTMRVFSPKS